MASKRRQRRHACQRKRRLAKDDAFNIAVAMRQKQPPGEPPYDAYPCGQCGTWHVGKRPRQISQAIRSRRKSRG
jgi:hypothetical protein